LAGEETKTLTQNHECRTQATVRNVVNPGNPSDVVLGKIPSKDRRVKSIDHNPASQWVGNGAPTEIIVEEITGRVQPQSTSSIVKVLDMEGDCNNGTHYSLT